jgi:hypothetical protein
MSFRPIHLRRKVEARGNRPYAILPEERPDCAKAILIFSGIKKNAVVVYRLSISATCWAVSRPS